MMIKPGISELSKCVDSRYTLVTMAAKRARMIADLKNRIIEKSPHSLFFAIKTVGWGLF